MTNFSPKEILLWRWLAGLWHLFVGIVFSIGVFMLLKDANMHTNTYSASFIEYVLGMVSSVGAGVSFLCAIEHLQLRQYKYKLDEYISRWQQYKHKGRPVALFVFCVIWAIERIARSACFAG